MALAAHISIKLLGTALSRGASLLIPKILRLRKIDQTLRHIEQKNEHVRAAISDYQTVVGSYQGSYSTILSAFLTELEKTSIADAMVEAALLKRPSPATNALFHELYYRFFLDTAPPPAELYDALYKSFSVTLRELSTDKIIYDLLSAIHSSISARFDRLENAVLQNSTPATATYDALAPSIQRISKALQQSFRMIRVETTKGARNVDITSIYIPPRLCFRPPTDRTDAVIGPTSHDIIARMAPTLASKADGLRQGNLTPTEHATQELSCFSFSEIKASFGRIVVLGDPGGGKSTLCQRICYDLAKNATLSIQYGDRREIPAAEQKVPFRIILRLYEKARLVEPQLDILTYICRDIQHIANLELADIRTVIQYLFSTGRALFAFDGLDEILETAKRREFVDLVHHFTDMFPLCPVLVTSRVVGYDFAPLRSEFQQLVLEKFEEDEVKDYTTKFMQVVGERDAETAALEADRFIAQTRQNAEDLRNNPLMLGLMAWLFLSRGDVPSNRPEIYRDCAILMFERWDQDRGIHADIPKGFDRLQLFSALAAEIYVDPALRAGVEKDWLEKAVRNHFAPLFESRAKANEAARSLVHFLIGRAWVMTEVGDGIFAFAHQTFLEYFFSKSIDDRIDTVRSLVKELRPRIVGKEWDVVVHLALQIKTYRNARRQEEAAHELIKIVEKSRTIKDRESAMSFLANSLEYISPTEGVVKQIIWCIFDNCMRSSNKDIGFSILERARRKARSRAEFVDRAIVDMLTSEVRGSDLDRSEKSASEIGYYSSVFKIGPATALLRNSPILDGEVRYAAMAELKSFVLERSSIDERFARICWSWFNIADDKTLKSEGIVVYLSTVITDSIYGIDGISNALLFTTPNYRNNFVNPNLSVDTSQEAISKIGEFLLSSSSDIYKFPRSPQMSVPVYVWSEILKAHERNSRALACIFYVMLCQDHLVKRTIGSRANNLEAIEAIMKCCNSWVNEGNGTDAMNPYMQDLANRTLILMRDVERLVKKGRMATSAVKNSDGMQD